MERVRCLVLHNLTADNLRFAHDLGGLPCPSLAVVREDRGGIADHFGNITLIGRSHLLNPRREPIFTGDIYSARHPEPTYKRVRAAQADQLLALFKPAVASLGDDDLLSPLWDALTHTPNREKAIDLTRKSTLGKAAFLAQNGVIVQAIQGARSLRSGLDEETVRVLRPAFDHAREDPSDPQRIDAMVSVAREHMLRAGHGEDTVYEWLDLVRPGLMDNLERDFEALKRPPPVDWHATSLVLDDAINKRGLKEEFDAWTFEKVGSLFEPPHLVISGKRVPFKLDTIVRWMRRGGIRDREGQMFYGAGNIRALTSRCITSVKQLHEAADELIVDEAIFEQARDRQKQDIQAYIDQTCRHTRRTNYRREIDLIQGSEDAMQALARCASMGHFERDALRRALDEHDISDPGEAALDIGLRLAQAIAHAPVPYFECKPQRAVLLQEFAVAVIPAKASADVREILERHGLHVVLCHDQTQQTEAVRQAARRYQALLDVTSSRESSDVLPGAQEASPSRAQDIQP